MIGGDSVYEAIAKVVLGILRQSTDIDYRALYGGTVLYSDGDLAAVQPDDQRIGNGGTLANCRVRRLDGATSVPTQDSGVRCLIGWEGGDDAKRYCLVGFDGQGTIDALLFEAQQAITLDAPLVDATADLRSQHEIGRGAGAITATGLAPIVTNASASGSDAEFDFVFDVADMQTLVAGVKIADVELARGFPSAPKCQVTLVDGAWGSGAVVTYSSSAPKSLSLYYRGVSAIAGPQTGLRLTVFVRATS